MSARKQSIGLTRLACYAATVSQGVMVNIAPILFIPLRGLYGLSYEQMGLLVLLNFTTQIISVLLLGPWVDRLGFRRLAVIGPILTMLGFGIFASAAFGGHAFGLLAGGSVTFSMAAAMTELTCSPIVNALPSQQKGADMSLLHSMFAWGQVGAIVGTTLILRLIGNENWWVIVLGWQLLPLTCCALFSRCYIPPTVLKAQTAERRAGVDEFAEKQARAVEPGGKRAKLAILGRRQWIAFACVMGLMVTAGAAEMVMGQWASVFMERGLALPKLWGDLLGASAFGLMMGMGRLWYAWAGRERQGKKGLTVNGLSPKNAPKKQSHSLARVVGLSGGITALCYLVAVVSPWPWLSMVACGGCGLCVSLIWPGTFVLATERFPKAGTWLFAAMTAAGNIGCALGPWLTGVVAEAAPRWVSAQGSLDAEQLGLRLGLMVGVVFALPAVFFARRLRKSRAEGTASRAPRG